jgi:hypothetical protein
MRSNVPQLPAAERASLAGQRLVLRDWRHCQLRQPLLLVGGWQQQRVIISRCCCCCCCWVGM